MGLVEETMYMEDLVAAQEFQPNADGGPALLGAAAFPVSDILLTASRTYDIELSLSSRIIIPNLQIKIMKLREIK